MRILVVGASGAIGARLVPQSIKHEHTATGTDSSPTNAERVRALSAGPVALVQPLQPPALMRRRATGGY
jgi:nucleoside-diphosphate-sugar epimerase